MDKSVKPTQRFVLDNQLRNLIENCYKEEHRFFHNWNHISSIKKYLYDHTISYSEVEKAAFWIFALFHDIVYDPTKKDNEKKSAEMMRELLGNHEEVNIAYDLILQSANFEKSDHPCFLADTEILRSKDFNQLLQYEQCIFKEFQLYSYPEYKEERCKFLQKAYNIFENPLLLALKDFVSNRRPNIGLYAGSFDPFHKGHLNIVHKAEKLFDKVIVAPGRNPSKHDDKKANSLKDVQALKYRNVIPYNELLSDLIKKLEIDYDVTLVRGIRNGNDLNYETNQLAFLQDLLKITERPQHVIIICDKEYEHISSSAIKGLNKFCEGYTYTDI